MKIRHLTPLDCPPAAFVRRRRPRQRLCVGRDSRHITEPRLCHLGEVVPPHGVFDRDKYQRLVQAYLNHEDINPVVLVLKEKMRPRALSGSHRIAAMRKAFGHMPLRELSAWVLFVEWDDLRSPLFGLIHSQDISTVRVAEHAYDGLEKVFSGQLNDFVSLVEDLLYLDREYDLFNEDPDVAEALEDQR